MLRPDGLGRCSAWDICQIDHLGSCGASESTSQAQSPTRSPIVPHNLSRYVAGWATELWGVSKPERPVFGRAPRIPIRVAHRDSEPCSRRRYWYSLDVGAYEPKFLHGALEFLGSR